MANTTPNYNLIKPLGTEKYDVAVPNANMDNIDLQLKNLEDTKVDAEAGKGLSEENYTLIEKNKVANLPDDTIAQLADIENKSFKLTNEIVNGNFVNGTTKWEGTTTLTASNKILISTATAASPSPLVAQVKIVNIVSSKLFLMAKTRVTNADCTSIVLQSVDKPNGISGVKTIKTIVSPLQNVFYDIYGTVDITSCDSMTLYIRHNYSTAAIASGKIMEVDGNAGVFVINMTNLGISDFTSNEMFELLKLTGYFEGDRRLSENEMLRFFIKQIRQNRNAIIALGGTII